MAFAAGESAPVRQPHLAVNLREKLTFLQLAENYPMASDTVAAVETRMAWVFLTEARAYKLKKPNFRLEQDYSTIDARLRDSRLELKLNRPLAEDVYLDVCPLRVEASGRLSLDSGTPCDWLLVMRRLPAERMLESMLREHTAPAGAGRAIGQRLAGFYPQRPPVAMSYDEYRERFRRGIVENRRRLQQSPSLQSAAETIAESQLRFVDNCGTQLEQALNSGRVRECHGDLRPEHVCLEEPVKVIDCLQFFRDYRLMDYLDDTAFLALECERLGDAQLGRDILAQLTDLAGGAPDSLLHFYQSYRAGIRARLAYLHLAPYGPSHDRTRWLGKSRRYLELAGLHIAAALSA